MNYFGTFAIVQLHYSVELFLDISEIAEAALISIFHIPFKRDNDNRIALTFHKVHKKKRKTNEAFLKCRPSATVQNFPKNMAPASHNFDPLISCKVAQKPSAKIRLHIN